MIKQPGPSSRSTAADASVGAVEVVAAPPPAVAARRATRPPGSAVPGPGEARTDAAPASDPSTGSGDLADRRPHLLLVDDQSMNVFILRHAFEGDHRVSVALSGVEGLALCARGDVDLVLLDVMMPGMDGHEVCRLLKVDPATRDIPIIFVTSRSDESAEAQALDLGAVDFISKPVNARVVRARVRTHLTLKAQSDRLRQWAYVDGLTGVCNRRYFDARLESEWRRAARNQAPLSVVLIDVDFFKRFNDRYGHQAGDDCLRRVAECLRSSVKRPGDLVARYGGEEFVCLLPDTDLQGALHVARDLGRAIDALRIEHGDSTVAPWITVSLGVCGATADIARSAADMLRVADAQLYLAKSGGRHRSCGAALGTA
jgi:diguanylate cyclase (GGDEF)-like protein